MIPELERYLVESTLVCPREGSQSGDLRFIVEKSHNKLLVYIFAYAAERPAFFAKIATVDYKVELLRHEHALLTQLASVLPRELSSSLPKAVAFQTCSGGAFAVQAALEGVPMSCRVGGFGNPFWKRKAEADFRIALKWLTDLGRGTLSRWPGAVDSRLGPAASSCPFSVAYHGDFGPQHILIGNHLVEVIDWELGSRHGPPAFDLFNFALRYMALMRKSSDAFSGHHEKSTVVSVFFDKNRFSRLFADCATEYGEALGIGRSTLKELLRLYLGRLGDDFEEFRMDFEKGSVL